MAICYFLAVILFLPGVILAVISEDRPRRFGIYMVIIAIFFFIAGIMMYSANHRYFEDRDPYYNYNSH